MNIRDEALQLLRRVAEWGEDQPVYQASFLSTDIARFLKETEVHDASPKLVRGTTNYD